MTRRNMTVMAMAFVMVVSLIPAVALADATGEAPVYLSVGTSLAAGSMADADGNTTFSSNVAYTDQLHRRLVGRLAVGLEHVKLGCPGETADQMGGAVDVFGRPSNCAAIYATGSQLGDAVAVLGSRDVRLVTIDMGANDIFHAQFVCGGDPACIGAAIPDIAGKVAGIVATLRATGYSGPIIGMNYYNPQVANAIGYFSGVPGQADPDVEIAVLSDAVIQGLNGALAAAYGATGASVADVYGAFNAGDFGDDRPENGIPDNVDQVCRLTFMCPRDAETNANIHPNRRGYSTIAKAFMVQVIANS